MNDIWPLKFDGKKYAFRQAKDGIILSFVVHPEADCIAVLAAAEIGFDFEVSLEPIKKTITESGSAPAQHERLEASGQAPALPAAGQKQQSHKRLVEEALTRSLTLSQKAGMLADDLQFQVWASKQIPVSFTSHESLPKTAKEFIYRRCGISSLKELNTDDGARDLYHRMYRQFRNETGS